MYLLLKCIKCGEIGYYIVKEKHIEKFDKYFNMDAIFIIEKDNDILYLRDRYEFDFGNVFKVWDPSFATKTEKRQLKKETYYP